MLYQDQEKTKNDYKIDKNYYFPPFKRMPIKNGKTNIKP